VELIFKATKYARGGEIFILKMNAFRLLDLADAMRNVSRKMGIPEPRIIETGLVQGEKVHEDLINDIETQNIYEFDGMYIIGRHHDGARKISSIRYNSKDAEKITPQELESLVMEYMEQAFHFSKIKGSK
jgi:UDP-N-acetylglucosamine 4,6-dehydratase